MNDEYIKSEYNIEDLKNIINKLRQPDGCPWDREQTYESMRQCVIDEAAEVIEAIDNRDCINLKEELGDLLFQVVMYSDIAKERGEFTFEDVVNELSKKMIRRHPHVFGDLQAAETELKPLTDRGVSRWNAIKFKEKEEKLKEYERLYKEGKISLELLESRRKYLLELKKTLNIS